MKKVIGIIIIAAIFAIPLVLFLTQNKNKTAYNLGDIQNLIAQGDTEFVAGENYSVYEPPLATSSPDKIEVVDIFWYGCPSCYHFQNNLESWRKTLGNDVVFLRKPVPIRRDWVNHAKMWLTAKELGMEEKLHQKIFDAIHKERLQLSSIGTITEFFIKNGVDELKFKRIFNSPKIAKEIQKLNREMMGYKIGVTPSLVINGHYLIPGTDNDKKMLKIADYLIAKERLATQSAKQ